MAVAIANFVQLENKGKIMILGDMFELGDESQKEHEIIVDSLTGENECLSYLIGKSFYEHKILSDTIKFFESFDSFADYLKTIQFRNNTILIKGSRGMALERTLEYIL